MGCPCERQRRRRELLLRRTNETVRRLDPTRPTAGTRSTRRSQLLEDVYAYTDYSYHGRGVGCEARTAVTPDTRKGYLISEFEGAQFPAKSFDDEPHRLAQALRYAAVLNDTIAQQGVAGSFGWCMTDYNTHREFGSGDRISYQGVMDMFRSPKLSAAVYAQPARRPAPLPTSCSKFHPAWRWVTIRAALRGRAGRSPTPRACGSTGTTTS